MTQMTVRKASYGFTLIELLIVVAIIAILAAIAIVNFLAAQTRTKVARVNKEMQTLATALESYYVDNTAYPLCYWANIGGSGPPGWGTPDFNPYYLPRLVSLSTPIAYISSIPKDMLNPGSDSWTAGPSGYSRTDQYNTYIYYTREQIIPYLDPFANSWTKVYEHAKWRLASYGPQRTRVKEAGIPFFVEREIGLPEYEYDPTNGIISKGFVTRHGP